MPSRGHSSSWSTPARPAAAGGDRIWDARRDGPPDLLHLEPGNGGADQPAGHDQHELPGVEILDGTAVYPDIPAGGTAGALAPYFTPCALPPGVACGAVIPFDVQMTAAGGSWDGLLLPEGGRQHRHGRRRRSTKTSRPASPPPGRWWTAASAPGQPPPGRPPTPASRTCHAAALRIPWPSWTAMPPASRTRRTSS